MTHVVTAFLRHRGEVLLARRSDAVGTYAGRWGAVSGYVEGDPGDALADARREVREEAGLVDPTLVRAGEPLWIREGDREWTVHPFLFEVGSRAVTPDGELAAVEWAPPTAMLARETVPALWTTYRRVAPTVATVREDREHGSATLSVRALEVLRDEAAVADWSGVVATARALRAARPGMAALRTRVDRTMHGADTPAGVRDRAHAGIGAALEADERAGAAAATLLGERAAGTVLTLSRSGTVRAALAAARPAVVVAESRPGGEGVAAAEALAGAGLSVTLVTDATVHHALEAAGGDAALVGADAVHPDGSVRNKVGTTPLALAADRAGVPLYAVTAADKVWPAPPGDGQRAGPDSGALAGPDPDDGGERADPAEVYDGEGVDVLAPLFERVPADLVAGVVTEAGALDADAVAERARAHRRLAGWLDAVDGEGAGAREDAPE